MRNLPGFTPAEFQSTPAIADGRFEGLVEAASALDLFQSTPAIADGRFYLQADWETMREDVSIHARHC